MNRLLAMVRWIQTSYLLAGKRRYLSSGTNLHVGRGTRLWAPDRLEIGSHVYIGKQVNIEANCEIGDFCLIANRVAIIGRHDHDYSAVGFPMRYSPWVGSDRWPSPYRGERAVIEADVWLGYSVVVLTGVTIGRGAVVAAGSLVASDLPAYCIAAGVPARVIGHRFSDPQMIADHEQAIGNGRFRFSERGYDHCLIEPAAISAKCGP